MRVSVSTVACAHLCKPRGSCGTVGLRILAVRSGPAEHVEVKYRDLFEIEPHGGRAGRGLVVEIGAAPVDHRHEIVADDVDPGFARPPPGSRSRRRSPRRLRRPSVSRRPESESTRPPTRRAARAPAASSRSGSCARRRRHRSTRRRSAPRARPKRRRSPRPAGLPRALTSDRGPNHRHACRIRQTRLLHEIFGELRSKRGDVGEHRLQMLVHRRRRGLRPMCGNGVADRFVLGDHRRGAAEKRQGQPARPVDVHLGRLEIAPHAGQFGDRGDGFVKGLVGES